MDNPFKNILDELREVKVLLNEVKEKLPEENPIKRYSPQEIADETGISVQTVWAALKDGRIKGKKFGKRYLITPEEFDRACSEIKTIKYRRIA